MTEVKQWFTPEVRRWLYGIAFSVSLLCVGYNVITQDQASLWVGVVGAILSQGMAFKHTNPNTPDGMPERDLTE